MYINPNYIQTKIADNYGLAIIDVSIKSTRRIFAGYQAVTYIQGSVYTINVMDNGVVQTVA